MINLLTNFIPYLCLMITSTLLGYFSFEYTILYKVRGIFYTKAFVTTFIALMIPSVLNIAIIYSHGIYVASACDEFVFGIVAGTVISFIRFLSMSIKIYRDINNKSLYKLARTNMLLVFMSFCIYALVFIGLIIT